MHSWRKLANVLHRLPSSSAFVEAQANDPDYAAWVASLPDDGKPGRPRLADFTPTVAMLANIHDRLGELIATVIATTPGAGRPPKVPPTPRPVTAIEKARVRADQARHDSLVAEVKAAQARWAANHEGRADASSG